MGVAKQQWVQYFCVHRVYLFSLTGVGSLQSREE